MKYGNPQRLILFPLYERNNTFNEHLNYRFYFNYLNRQLTKFSADTTFSLILESGKKILNEKDSCGGNSALVIYGL